MRLRRALDVVRRLRAVVSIEELRIAGMDGRIAGYERSLLQHVSRRRAGNHLEVPTRLVRTGATPGCTIGAMKPKAAGADQVSRARDALRARGMRWTPQRRALLEVL